ncbi:MAG: hypothetical protein H0T92_02545, partial [Pyrinomonadaceae bacterium]|nr:hypothetical protein [Pyrinomonadaceae bacterium]
MRDRPRTAKRDAVEEAQRADGLVEGAPRDVACMDEVKLVVANLVGAEQFGR